MADAPAYTSYQLSQGTLNTMKEAAGNYMPDYGNWRYLDPPAPPEPEKKKKTGSDSESWGNKGTGGKVGEVLTESDAYKSEAKMSDEEWKEFLANETAEEKQARYKREVKRGVRAESTGGTDDNSGGRLRTFDIEEDGSYTNIIEELYGESAPDDFVSELPSGESPNKKRSPYKMDEGESHSNADVRPGSFADPLSGVELKAARQAIIDRGSTASIHYHDQAKEIVKDIKANMFQQGEDEKTKKDNQVKSHVTLNTLSTGVQNLFGPEGAIENFIGLMDDGNVSEGFRNKGVMAKILKGDPDVKLGVTPENNIVLQVPGLNGEPMAISASDINDMTEKAVTQYAFGAKASSGYSALIDAGRSGLPYDSEAVKTESRRLLKELGPNGLASVLGDKGIITDEPLIKHAGDAYWADADVDPWELIHETMKTEEGEADALELGVEALERVAFNKHAMGYAEFQKENSGGLDAQALLDKYA
jgi:hypothetical protein